jgi:hypothetical protein
MPVEAAAQLVGLLLSVESPLCEWRTQLLRNGSCSSSELNLVMVGLNQHDVES